MAITLVEKSGNAKIGLMSATYRKVGETCPSTCRHLTEKTCYALTSFTGIAQRRSDASALDGMLYYSFVEKLSSNVKLLAKTLGLLRLHVSGDMFYNDKIDEMYVTGLKKAHVDFPNIIGYTYTHRFTDFGTYDFPSNLVVNASCDTLQDVKDATALGWPTVTTTDAGETRKRWEEDNITFLVCPNQTASLTCAACMLCMKPKRKFTIVFKAHGASKGKVKALS